MFLKEVTKEIKASSALYRESSNVWPRTSCMFILKTRITPYYKIFLRSGQLK